MDEFRTHLRDNGIDVGDTYEALWQWSVDQPAEFWRSLWQFYDLDGIAEKPLAEGADAVLANSEMPGARWFPDIRLNYVDQILRHSGLPGAAIVGIDETGARSEISWAELGSAVAGLAATLRDLGVGEGDVVAAYLPHIPEAVVAFLATASLGAIWSGCGQDYAPVGAAGRLGQLGPKVLFTADGYRYNGKDIDKAADSAELASLLPELRARIVVGGGGDDADVLDYRDAVAAGDPTTLQPVKVAFDHPLWVLFSSGTTGRPKGIVHGHGGVVVEHT